jgi:AraC family transcriptional regulator
MGAMDVTLKPVEELIFRSDIVAIGSFRCPVTHPLFHDSGPCSHHTFVFPRTATGICREGERAFIAAPGMVTCYNQNQVYRRTAVSGSDDSDWYVVTDDVLRDAVSDFDPDVFDRPSKPFTFAATVVDPGTFLEQRVLFERASSIDASDIDERVLRLLSRVLRSAYASRARHADGTRLNDAVEDAARLIARDPARNLSLREIAAAVGSSPFHLCRAFSRIKQTTMTGYRHMLRLSAALERLRDHRVDLTDVALDLGYSSHSHFTRAFRVTFGIPPSSMRNLVIASRGAAQLAYGHAAVARTLASSRTSH